MSRNIADEQFIAELRQRQLTTQGRAKLRERVAVEHSLSHIGRWQGDKSRYLGVRKNLFDERPRVMRLRSSTRRGSGIL